MFQSSWQNCHSGGKLHITVAGPRRFSINLKQGGLELPADFSFTSLNEKLFIVGKGGQTPFFSKIPLFLEIQDVPTFHRFIRKTKVMNNSCKQFVCNFYPQSILVLEESLQKW